jgi:tRNA nucleotidyltransferase (CCA-adding enzyme)
LFKNGDDELATIVLSQETVTDSAVRRLVFDAGEDVENLMTCVKLILPLNQINSKNTTVLKLFKENVEVEERVIHFQPPITGEEIMEIFNLKPSKEIDVKEAIKEAILEGEIANEYQAV